VQIDVQDRFAGKKKREKRKGKKKTDIVEWEKEREKRQMGGGHTARSPFFSADGT